MISVDYIMNALEHSKVRLPFFYTPCISYYKSEKPSPLPSTKKTGVHGIFMFCSPENERYNSSIIIVETYERVSDTYPTAVKNEKNRYYVPKIMIANVRSLVPKIKEVHQFIIAIR